MSACFIHICATKLSINDLHTQLDKKYLDSFLFVIENKDFQKNNTFERFEKCFLNASIFKGSQGLCEPCNHILFPSDCSIMDFCSVLKKWQPFDNFRVIVNVLSWERLVWIIKLNIIWNWIASNNLQRDTKTSNGDARRDQRWVRKWTRILKKQVSKEWLLNSATYSTNEMNRALGHLCAHIG